MKSNCIIIGGSGFIGSHLVRSFIENEKYKYIYIIDKNPPKIKYSSVVFYKHDIRNAICFRNNFNDVDLFHLSALCKEPGYSWNEYFETNYMGTKNVCDFLRQHNINNVVFTSTMMVYRAQEKEMFEESLTAPDTAYGISKLLAEKEMLLWQAEDTENRKLYIIRSGVVFGKGENGNYTRLYKALKKRVFFYIGKSTTVKSSIYIEDLVRFIEYLANSENKVHNIIFNMAFPQAYTIKDICEAFFRTFEFNRKLMTVPYKLALFASYFFVLLNYLKILKTSVHPRRIQKLYYSTYINSDKMLSTGFELKYDLVEALKDWHKDCLPDEIF